jgi:hypothetical protein
LYFVAIRIALTSIFRFAGGHTLNDLARGVMKRPWADLTSLGLYKRHGGNWGYDFVTGLVQRMDGADCCTLSNDALYDYVKGGGFRWLPKFLHGEYSLETSFDQGVTWYQYLSDTIRRCHEFTCRLHIFAVVACLCIVAAIHLHPSHRACNSGTNAVPSAPHRILTGYASLYVLSLLMRKSMVSQASWTRDIRDGNKDVVTFPFQPGDYEGPATSPTSLDVLIGSRLDSKHLGMYADFLQYHPGNKLWHDAILSRLEWLPQYSALPRGMEEELARRIVDDVVETKASRFLYQVPSSGKWIVLDRDAAANLTTQEIFLRSHPALQCLAREIRFLRSDCLYGPLRDTKLCRLDSSLLNSLVDRIRHPSMRRTTASRDQAVQLQPSPARSASLQPRRSCCTRTPTTVYAAEKIPSSISQSEKNKIRTSLVPQEGDTVQVLHGAMIDDASGGIVPAWWLGKVATVHPLGTFHVWLEASDASEPFGATLVCSVVDDDCMDAAEQYEGWVRSANGTYMNAYESELEFHEAEDSALDFLEHETDD